MNYKKILINGLWDQNPTFRLVLGMCPTLAVTTSAVNGVSMGLATTFALVLSNLSISLLRNMIPDRIRIPSFVVVIATCVTIIEMLIKAFFPALNDSLGIYIPLIVVNCIIFARAESFAFKNAPLASIVDGFSVGLGFTVALTLLASVRELIGAGTIFAHQFMPAGYEPMIIAVQAPGGFIVLGLLLAVMNTIMQREAASKGASEP